MSLWWSATAATRGTRAALVTVIGTTLGNAALLACIALGLNWILKTSAEVFEVLRWVGAAYLIWLGIQTWRTAGHAAEAAPPRHRVHISRGFLVAITNPKTIAFFTAFLPQFVDPGAAGGLATVRDVRGDGGARRPYRRGLGRCGGFRPRLVHEAAAQHAAWPTFGRRTDRRRPMAVVGAADRLAVRLINDLAGPGRSATAAR